MMSASEGERGAMKKQTIACILLSSDPIAVKGGGGQKIENLADNPSGSSLIGRLLCKQAQK